VSEETEVAAEDDPDAACGGEEAVELADRADRFKITVVGLPCSKTTTRSAAT